MNTSEQTDTVPQPSGEANRPRDTRMGQLIEEHAAELRALRAEREAFARTLKHVLSGPLTCIGGFADLLLDQTSVQLDVQSRQYLLAIITATNHLEHVLNEAVAFPWVSRVGRGESSAGSEAGRAIGADEAASRPNAVAMD